MCDQKLSMKFGTFLRRKNRKMNTRLQNILASLENIDEFNKTVKTWMQENFWFVKAVEALYENPSLEGIQDIVNTYVREGSDFQVNLDFTEVNEILEKMKTFEEDQELTRKRCEEIFANAYVKISNLIKHNNLVNSTI